MVGLPFLVIYKASAGWVCVRSMLGRARGTRVFDISSFAQEQIVLAGNDASLFLALE